MEIKTLSAFRIIGYGFRQFWHHLFILLVSLIIPVFLAVAILATGLGLLAILVKMFASIELSFMPYLGCIVGIILFYAYFSFVLGLYLGLYRIYLDICRSGQGSLYRIFSCMGHVPCFIIAYICYTGAVILGLFFFILPGIIFAVRFQLYIFFIIEKAAGPLDALKCSYRATKGNFWHFLLLWLFQKLSYGLLIILFPVAGLASARAYSILIKNNRLDSDF